MLCYSVKMWARS